MGTGLPEVPQAAMTVDLKLRKPSPETRLAPAKPIRPLPRLSRTTLADVLLRRD